MNRTIKQIVTGTDGKDMSIGHTLYALCDDNTVWKLYCGEHEWIKVPKIPGVQE